MNLLEIYREKNVLVTGGASFIGSHLVESLISYGAKVTVADNLSTGAVENLSGVPAELIEGDLRSEEFARSLFSLGRFDFVFHLAAIHGGRGFIESREAQILENLKIDFNVFNNAVGAGAGRIFHASSACAYPVNLQNSETDLNLLAEDDASMTVLGKAYPDGAYGWVKLMGEYQLQKIVQGSRSTGRSGRIFTAYGERENETHAAVALAAKAFLGLDPYPIWGSGEQTRNFTHVSDTVKGIMLIAADDRPLDFDVFNIGTSNHITVNQFIAAIFAELNWHPKEILRDTSKPTGVASRASDNTKIREIFDWEPSVSIDYGVQRLLNWYSGWNSRATTIEELNARL